MKPDVFASVLVAISACNDVVSAAPRPVHVVESKALLRFPLRGRSKPLLEDRAYCSSSSSSSCSGSYPSSSGSSSSGSSGSGSSSSGSSSPSSGSSSSGSSSSSPGSSSSGSSSSSSGSSSSGSSSSGSSSSGSSSSGSSSSGSSSSGSSSSGSSSSGSSSSGSSSSGSSSSGSSSSSCYYGSCSSSSSSGSGGPGQLTENMGMDYTVNVALGSSGTIVPLTVDTGSTDLLVNTANVPDDSSIVAEGQTCHESYGGDAGTSEDGSIYSATYTLAGVSLSNDFCNAVTVHGSGTLGLGFPIPNPGSVSAQTGTSPLQALQNAGVNSFAIYIGTSGSGELTLNGYDAKYILGGSAGSFTTESISPTVGGHWGFPFTAFAAGDNSGTPLTTIGYLDSGASGIRVDPQTASAIWAGVGASATDGSIACGTSAPPITFTFGGGTYSLPSSIYITKTSPTTCHVVVQPIDNYGDSSDPKASRGAVIGNPFIKAYYAYFDIANQQIQLAPSVG